MNENARVDAAAFVLKHLAVVALIASTALALGLPWIRGLPMNALARGAVALAVGLGGAGHLALALGLVGRLEPAALVALVLAAHVAAWRDLGDLGARARLAWWRQAPLVRWLGVGLGVLALSPIVLCALYPPTAFDETLYHLPYAREFARTRGLAFLPDLRFPIFPQLAEAFFAAVLALAGDVATHGVSLVATLAGALLVAAWAGRAPRVGCAAAALGAAILLGQPVGIHLATSAYIEAALALFVAAAFYSAERWRDDGDGRWLALAGFFAGTAASTKYLGLLVVVGVAIEIAVVAARRGFANLLAYGGMVAAAMAVSYGRVLAYTGNPVFPLFPALFGASPWDVSLLVRKLGVQDGLALLGLPWSVVFDRAAVGGLPPYSPLIPLGLPVVVAVAWRSRQVRGCLVRVVGFVLFAPLGAHYVWTIVPLVAVAYGVSVAHALDRLRGATAGARAAWPLAVRTLVASPAAWALLCVLPGSLYGAYQLVRLGPMPTSVEARTTFLTARLPLFAAVNALNDRCGAGCTVYAVHAERMVYFAAGRFLGDWNGPASFARTLPVDGDPRTLLARLERLGANYLLVPVASRRQVGLFGGDAPGFRHVYGDAAADVYEVSR